MSEQTERERLEALWFKTQGTTYVTDSPERQDRLYRFSKMLDAGAYESAALMLAEPLIAKGWFFDLDVRPPSIISSASYTHPHKIERGVWYRHEDTSPVRALCAAIEQAIAREGE